MIQHLAELLSEKIPMTPAHDRNVNKLFCYGILKKGFALDLEHEGAKFLGEATLQPANIYRIGGGVGLAIEDRGKVHGEVFEIPEGFWKWLDRIEGHPYTYQRQVFEVSLNGEVMPAWVYVHQHPNFFGALIQSGNYTGTEADLA